VVQAPTERTQVCHLSYDLELVGRLIRHRSLDEQLQQLRWPLRAWWAGRGCSTGQPSSSRAPAVVDH